ncbi:MAG: DUF2330 domain-containing protein, partial [Gammaproteobacteria bacterium]|nr:DUF2330 domain-containing protein [Gammaproteobacteria bacterium]
GMVNAKGAQELFVYALTRTGRVETTNYRTVKLPTGSEIPPHVKEEFNDFYRAMFTKQVDNENMRGVFLEYAWDMAWCDPCAADPLSRDQLRNLGVFWLEESLTKPAPFTRRRPAPQTGGPVNVYVTRLHLRYDNKHFPEDLMFQETGDRTNFQGRYVLRHPWLGKAQCPAATEYRRQLLSRQQKEASTLANLTGWRIADIRDKMQLVDVSEPTLPKKRWWERLWN